MGSQGESSSRAFVKYCFPLIRYEIGDMGRIVSENCPCGRTNRILDYQGRSDDMICVGTMNIRYRDVLAALDGLSVSALQIVIRSGRVSDRVVLKVESDQQGEIMKREIFERRC